MDVDEDGGVKGLLCCSGEDGTEGRGGGGLPCEYRRGIGSRVELRRTIGLLVVPLLLLLATLPPDKMMSELTRWWIKFSEEPEWWLLSVW